jgi:hypothetical protein
MAFNEITFTRLKSEVEQYLREQFNKANLLFSNSSPYGQILSVLENLQQLSLLYLKKSQNNFDLGQNLTNNEIAVKNAAIFAGHIPGRAISATGTLKLTLKGGVEVEAEIQGGRLSFLNRGLMKNKTNGLDYSLNLGADIQTFRIDNNTQIYIPIIQGKWESRTVTGDGTLNQTFNIDLRGRKQVENFNYEILVNSEIWEAKKHLYDLMPGEKACIVRTGFNGGLDIIFGNESFGAIPTIGSEIRVNYLVSSGSEGSIFRRTSNDFTFVDDVLDGFGNPVNIENVFTVEIFTDINFGADAETIQFTRNILPIASNNFVLGTPQQFAYEIKKLGVFSHVNAYENNGTVFVVATPNIQLFKNRNSNYFTISQEAFILDNYEKSKILTYLRSNGNIVLTTNIVIDSPVLSYYVCNVFIITYSDAIDDSVNAQIYDKISEYFLNLNRIDRIPKVDLVNLISDIPEIHSVDISFMSKKTEDYHRNNTIFEQNRRNKFTLESNITIERPDPNYEEDRLIGIDPILGDILFEPQEIPVVRGGWLDRNRVFYSDGVDGSGLKSVNIIKKGTVDVKNKQKI